VDGQSGNSFSSNGHASHHATLTRSCADAAQPAEGRAYSCFFVGVSVRVKKGDDGDGRLYSLEGTHFQCVEVVSSISESLRCSKYVVGVEPISRRMPRHVE